MPVKIQPLGKWPSEFPLVSVVIPCYNYGRYLDEAVQSVLSQTWQNLEIIVVNDGSTQAETISILEHFQRPKTRILHLPENKGLPAARNAGIDEAHGKYICCLDADDKLHPTYLEKMIIAMEANAGISFAWSWTQIFGDEDRVWYAPQFDPYEILFWNQLNSLGVFKRSAWEQVGGFLEEMREGYEDWEFWIRLTENGYRGLRIPEKLVFVRRHGHSMVYEAVEKKDYLFQQIKDYHPNLYSDPRTQANRIQKKYCDIYSVYSLTNANRPSNYLADKVPSSLIVSDGDSKEIVDTAMSVVKKMGNPESLIWISNKELDEEATNLLYAITPFVFILPNFLPRYARIEFIHNMRGTRNIVQSNLLSKDGKLKL